MTWKACADRIVRKHTSDPCPHCEGTTTPEQTAVADAASLDLFAAPTTPPSNGTPTSDAAAASLTPETLSKLQRKVLDVIWQARGYGVTDEQIGIVAGLSGNTVRPRRGELEQAGFVEQRVWEGKLLTAPTQSGRQAALWYPTGKLVRMVELLRQGWAA